MKIIVGSLMLAASSVAAQGLEGMRIASDLGTLLGSAELCGLNFDPAAVEAYVREHVPPEDMSFPSTLRMMTDGTRAQNQELDGASKSAHCAAVRQSALHFGLIK